MCLNLFLLGICYIIFFQGKQRALMNISLSYYKYSIMRLQKSVSDLNATYFFLANSKLSEFLAHPCCPKDMCFFLSQALCMRKTQVSAAHKHSIACMQSSNYISHLYFLWSSFQFTSQSVSTDLCFKFISTHIPNQEKSLKSEVVSTFISLWAAGNNSSQCNRAGKPLVIGQRVSF